MKTLKSLLAAAVALFLGYVAEATVTVSPTELNWTVGEEVKDTLSATSDNTQLARATTTWSLGRGSALPDGVSFSNGVFSGTPTKSGDYSVFVSVSMSDTSGRNKDTITDVEIKITVESKGGGSEGGETKTPSIKTVSPSASTVELSSGQQQEFKVTAVENAPTEGVSYRWYRYSATGYKEISSATSSSYVYTQGSASTKLKVVLCAGDGTPYTGAEHEWMVACKAPDPEVSKYSPETSPVEQKDGEPTYLAVELTDPTATAYYYWYKVLGVAGSTLLSEGTSSSYGYEGGDAAQIKVEVWTSDKTKKIAENTWTLSAPVSDPEPEITAFSPTGTTIEMSTGDKQTFSVTAKSNDEGSPTYYWTDNNEAILDGSGRSVTSSSFEYEMTSARAKTSTHTIKCQVSNTYGKSVSQSWIVTYKAPTVVNPTIKSASPAGYGTSGNFLPAYVGEPVAFAVEVDNPGGTSFSYSWRAGGAVVATTSTYSWTPSNTGKTSVVCQLLVGGKSVASVTWMFDVTTKAPTITYSPTTLPAATESVAYAQTISFSGISGIMGANISSSPTISGATAAPDERDDSKLVFSWPSPVKGTYAITLQVFYGSSSTPYEINYTLMANEASGGGGGEGGDDKPTTVEFEGTAPTMPIDGSAYAMEVETPVTFSVSAKSTVPTGTKYIWYQVATVPDTAGGGTRTIRTKLADTTMTSYTYTPSAAGDFALQFIAYTGTAPDFETGSNIVGGYSWSVTVSEKGGEPTKPTIESADPSGTTVEMTEGETRKFSITVKDADRTTQYKWYAVSSTGGFAPISEASGTEYEFTNSGKVPALKVEVASTDGTVYDSRIWTIRTKSGTTTFTRESPRSEMVEMTVGETQSFSVSASGSTTGIGYNWSVTSDDDPSATVESKDLSCTFTPSKAGTYTVTFMYVSSGGSSGSVEWAVTVTSSEPETGILPILGIANEEFGMKLQNRASIWPGVFTNQIVRRDGYEIPEMSVRVLGQTPGDVEVTQGGLVTGTMTDDLDGESMTIETVWTPDAYSSFVMTNVLTFAKRKTSNTAPYLAGSSPAAAEMTAYLGYANMYDNMVKVFAFDEEVNTLTYKWFFDGVEKTGYTQSSYAPTSVLLGEVGSTHTVTCTASDGVNQDILLKTWKLTTAQPTFAFRPSTFGVNATVGGSPGLLEFRQPANDTYALRIDVVRGELPPGIVTFGGTGMGSDAFVSGIYRKAGTYSFTLRGICSNGDTIEQDFVITVGGTDSAAMAWTIGSGTSGGTTKGTTGGTTGKGGATTVPSITMALMQGAAAGDTMEINSINGGDEDLSAFRYLEDIAVTSHCTISLTIGAHVPDLTAFVFESGKDYKFKLSLDGSKYLLEDDSYGAFAPIAKMNADMPYQLDWSLGAPYFIGSPTLDADGYLSVAIGLTSINESTDLLHLPDNEAQRTVVFENATFSKNVKIVTDGVLPATITFAGTNTFAGTFNYLFEGYQDELKMIVPSDATVNFAGGSLYDSKLGGLVLEPGATLKFDPSADKMLFYGYRLYMPKAGQPKVRFVLTGTRAVGAGAYPLSARYMGDDDPMNVIEIVPQTGDATNYRVYRGAEQMLFFEAVQTPDAGDIVWTEDDNPSTAVGTLGGQFSVQFKAHGGSYRTFAYSLTDGAYTWSRAEENTFDNAIGTRELMQAAYRVGASEVSAPVEIGFPFPCGTNFIATVDIGANRLSFGDYVFFLQDKGFLATLTTLSHVFIDRQSDSFTVRWGEFASATLTPDGQIRVAFGPAADTRDAVDPQVPLYWIYDGSAYGLDLSSAEPYAGSNDIVVTPSCPPGLRLEGDTLTGVPLVPGAYSVNVKVVANGTYETNRTFTVAIAPERFREDAPVITVAKAPVTAADGYVHLDLGDSTEFEASVGSGQQMRWTLDGAPLAVSGGSYILTAPATRSLDAAGAKIHCLAIEADDGTGRWNFSVRKSWQVVYNRKVYIDVAKATSAAGGEGKTEDETTTTGGTRTDVGSINRPIADSMWFGGADGAAGERTDGGTTAGGGTTADGLTPETAFGEFPDDLFKYLLNGDEVIVAPGIYAKPIDFLANTAEVIIRAADANARPVIDLTGNTKGYTRCFRQGYYSVEVGYSGSYEQIYQPLPAALVQNFVLKGGAIEEDIHDEYAMQLYPESSVNYYGIAGGGAFGGAFENCTFRDCSAKDYGGGAYGANLSYCVIENCSAKFGGGCANCVLDNCTVVDNVATSKAGGIDGQCTARSSILYGNEAAGVYNDTDNTTTPVHLVPYVPTLVNCFTTADGDPAFCADYHLANGSPATGKGAFPTPDATESLVFVEIVGGGTVTPNDPDGTKVEIGGSLVLTAGGSRAVEAIYTNGVQAVGASSPFTLANVAANITVTFVFENAALAVGTDKDYKTIGAAIAAAQPGDTIKVDAGTYVERLDVSSFGGKLVIEAADTANPPVVNAAGAGRCVTAKRNSDDVVFKGLIFERGRAAYTSSASNPHYRTELASLTDAQLLADGFGGGVFGGRFENCTIRNCTAQGGMGGGAFGATLVKCTVTGNVAGYKEIDDRLREVLGGGVYGGLADTCGISSNSVEGCKTQVYCLYDGAGTYDAEVRNSFVWDNYINCGSSESKIASETAKGENGVIIHTEEKAPTEARLEAHTTPIPQEGTTVVYGSQAEAETAAAKQVVEISTEVAKAISDQKAYEDLFEITSVETSEGSGEYYNKPTLKEEVVEVVETQVETALSADADGNPQSAEELAAELTPENQSMTKTVKTTTPGLYYALEFSSDMSDGSFVGERHLATGGSLKLNQTSLQTPSGFWRVNVYTTPDGN